MAPRAPSRPPRPRQASDRRYIALLRRWVRRAIGPATREILAAIEAARLAQLERQARADSDDDEDPQMDEETVGLLAPLVYAVALNAVQSPPPPPVDEVRAQGERARRVTSQGARRQLSMFGLRHEVMAARLEVPVDGVLGIDVAPTARDQALVEEWARENVDLITTQPEEWLRGRIAPDGTVTRLGVEQIVARRIRRGVRFSTLAKELRERLEINQGHAELIARDQIGKLNARITEDTQRQAGVDAYRWRTADDERVRGRPGGLYPDSTQRHWQMEGRVVRWDDPPRGTGPYGEAAHAGMSIQCRCYAEPILDEADTRERDERRMGVSVAPEDSQDETGRPEDDASRLPPPVPGGRQGGRTRFTRRNRPPR